MTTSRPSRSRTAVAAAAVVLAACGVVLTVKVNAGADVPGIECDGAQPAADGTFDIRCVGLIVPQPSTVTVTTPVPTVVPTTVTETVTTPVPSVTTVTVTPSTPAPTTPPPTTPAPTTPAPSPSSTPAGGCMPNPSACGWPDATNTGVPAGKTLTVRQGGMTISQAGTVIDGLDIRGCVTLNANNVTIRNSRIGEGCADPYYVVRSFNRSGILIEDSEIILTGWNTKGIAFDGYTARRVHFYGGSDCAHAEHNVVIEDSFCEIPTGGPSGGPHYDGFQSDGGNGIVIRHNTIRVPYGQTSAILMSTNTKPIYNVTIVDNLVAGGGWTIYCGTDEGGPVLGTLTFSGNVVARTYFPKGGKWGPTTWCPSSGWRWDA